uniref:Uncharacterized protein n=1 Tax=Anopheles melas TaxID=34690 RepID=A0A182TYN2_9DIPT
MLLLPATIKEPHPDRGNGFGPPISPPVREAGDAAASGVDVPPVEPTSTEAKLSDVAAAAPSSTPGGLEVTMAAAAAATGALSESQLLVASVASLGPTTPGAALLPSCAAGLFVVPPTTSLLWLEVPTTPFHVHKLLPTSARSLRDDRLCVLCG